MKKNHKRMGTNELFAEIGDPGSEDTFQARLQDCTATFVMACRGSILWVPDAILALGPGKHTCVAGPHSEADGPLPGSPLLAGPVPCTYNHPWLGRQYSFLPSTDFYKLT